MSLSRNIFVVTILAAVVGAGALAAQTIGVAGFETDRIRYRLSMPDPSTHLFTVTIEVDFTGEVPESIDFQIPMWSPGRYAVADFGKNVQQFAAAGDGELVSFVRKDTQTWSVRTQGRRNVRVAYQVFANTLSGTFAQLNSRHANYNGHELFMYVVGHKPDPVELEIDAPVRWRIINGYTTRANQSTWSFPDYDTMVDTPTEIAPDWTVDEFAHQGKTYRVMVHSMGDEGGQRPALVADIERIVHAQTEMWGAPDLDQYTFMIHFAADDRSGDGMEHLNSTQVIESGALADPGMYASAIGTSSHEFFHTWNVKRLRPVELGPWDFTRPLATRALWVVEGLTNYYGRMMLHRAGIWDERALLNRLGGTISNVEGSPGTRAMSVEMASMTAPFRDGAIHRQATNLSNTSISYYSKGEIVGLLLDLHIRSRTDGRTSLDDVMRRMYDEFYVNGASDSYYLQGSGYRVEDFERVASEVAGIDLDEFFRRYTRGFETPPYDEILSSVGLGLTRTPSRQPYTGGLVIGGALAVTAVRPDSAAARAGVEQGDTLLSIDGTEVNRGNWREVLNQHSSGSRVPVRLGRSRNEIGLVLVLAGPDVFDYRIEELDSVTDQQRAMRDAWLAGATF